MKKSTSTFIFCFFTLFLFAQDYSATFSATGESSSASTITVDNLSQKNLTLSGKNSVKSGVSDEITWKNVYNNYGPRCMLVNSKGHIIAGTWGVLLSEDNGENWTRNELPNSTYEINSLAIDSKDIIYATTFEKKLYQSVNDGKTWTQLFTDSTHIPFTCTAINSLDEIFIGTEDYGLFQLSNNIDSLKITGWSNSVEELFINKNNDMFITSQSVHRSTDRAKNWLSANTGLTNTGINSVCFNSWGDVFAGTAANNGGVFISKNNGDNWTVTKYSFYETIDSVVTALACNSADEIFIGTFAAGILKLSGDGNSLTAINLGLPSIFPIITAFTFTPDGHILAGTSNGIYKSEQVVTKAIRDYTVNAISFSPEQNYPNPFNTKTTIQYSIIKELQTKIEIINQYGQLVETLLNQNQLPGKYQISWDASNSVPGVYFYRIKTGDFMITKKMLLIKNE